MTKEEYLIYLQSTEWLEKRKILLARAGNECQLCSSDKSLQVHHRKYSNIQTEKEIDDLIVLCRRCHEITTFKIQGKKPAKKRTKTYQVLPLRPAVVNKPKRLTQGEIRERIKMASVARFERNTRTGFHPKYISNNA